MRGRGGAVEQDASASAAAAIQLPSAARPRSPATFGGNPSSRDDLLELIPSSPNRRSTRATQHRVGLGMVHAVKMHVDELLKLPPDERSEAAEVLLRSLEQEPEEDEVAVAAGWAAEIERRIGENASQRWVPSSCRPASRRRLCGSPGFAV